MVALRIGRAGVALDGAKLRIGRAGLDGTAVIAPKLRVGRGGLTGVAAVIVAPIAPQTVEPETTVIVTAALLGGGSVDSWTWRVASGLSVSLVGSGDTRSFVARSTMPPAGGQTVLGVRATVAGTTSPEVMVTITYLPQLSWLYDGSQWVGRRLAVAL